MSSVIQVILALVFFLVIGFFVAFNMNPESVCQDHSDRKLRKQFYECTPLKIKVKKELHEPNFFQGKF